MAVIAWSDTNGFLFLGGFVKDNVWRPPLPTTLHDLKRRITEAGANTDG
jgi:hypothetical protein